MINTIIGYIIDNIGLLGGLIFLISWVIQVMESKKKGYMAVTAKFFIVRIIGLGLSMIEAIRLGSTGLILLTGGGLVISIYNLKIGEKGDKKRII